MRGIQSGPDLNTPDMIEPKGGRLFVALTVLTLLLAPRAHAAVIESSAIQDGPDSVDPLGVRERPVLLIGGQPQPVDFDRAAYIWILGSTGAKILPDGRVDIVDCYDPVLWLARLGPEGPRLAQGFTGPGYELTRELARDAVQQRFVAMAKRGAFGPGPDLTEAWQNWLQLVGWNTLSRHRDKLSNAVQRAGLQPGEGLTFTPVMPITPQKCTLGYCDCGSCPSGATCECETKVGSGPTADCKPPRESCNHTTWGISLNLPTLHVTP